MTPLTIIALFFSLLILAVPSPARSSPQEIVSSPKSSWLPLWEKAKDLESHGSYLKAKEVYETLLKRKVRDARARRSIRKGYEALQMKIVFSPVETPDSFFHTVASGDTFFGLAKRYETTIELLRKSNALTGDRIYPGMKLKVMRAKFSILVEKNSNRLILLADGRSLKRYSVATGIGGSTPTGIFKIVNKLEDPTWYQAGKVLPPDSPENILGSRWLGFDRPGYGIHGTTLPKTIGTQSSKGCIRMFNSDVEEIYTLVPVGTSVTVKD